MISSYYYGLLDLVDVDKVHLKELVMLTIVDMTTGEEVELDVDLDTSLEEYVNTCERNLPCRAALYESGYSDDEIEDMLRDDPSLFHLEY